MDVRFLRQTVRLVGSYPLPVAVLVLGGIVSTFSEGVGIGLLIPFLDVVFHTGPGAAPGGWFTDTLHRFADAIDPERRALLLGGLIAALILIRVVLQFGTALLGAWIAGRVSHDLRAAVSHRLLGVAFAYIARAGKGRLLNTIAQETWRAAEAVRLLCKCLTAIIAVAVFTAVMLIISWRLTVLVLSGTLIISLLMHRLVRRARRLGRLAVVANRDLGDRMVSVLDGMRVIRLFGQESREQKHFTERSEAVRRRFLKLDATNLATQPLMEALYLPLFFAALVFALQGNIGLPTLVAFLFIFYRMAQQARPLGQGLVQLNTLRAAIEDVADLLDDGNKPQLRSGSTPIAGIRGAVRFENVTFAYEPGGPPALADVSFGLRRGEALALVGRSGAGKSTIVNLLCRFYDPSAGRISVDGTPLSEFDLPQWRAHIALAGQGVELMGRSIADNIRYGRPDAALEDVVAAAKEADAHDFIMRLPQGYDTVLDLWHGTVSGGQRQRIALARALLRRPEILILDEATSELDCAAEASIRHTLKRLKGRMTIVIVAHRLSTIRDADRLLVLDNGRVVEQGTPRELLGRGGMYARIAMMQNQHESMENVA